MKCWLLCLLSVLSLFIPRKTCLGAGADSLKLNWLVYAEPYHYPFSGSKSSGTSLFLYNYAKTQRPSVNLALGLMKAESSKARASVGLMAGTYVQNNLATEEPWARNIFEAQAGIKISKKNNIWLDAGVFPSHIGFESPIGYDCMHLTRSLAAENSPYYESGVKLSGNSKNKKFELELLLLNGWQRITPVNNKRPYSFGHRVTYKPSKKLSITSASFAGDASFTYEVLNRIFHHFNLQFNSENKWNFAFGFDYGIQQKSEKSSSYSSWWNNIASVEYVPNDFFRFKFRNEFFSDKQQVILGSPENKPFFANSQSLGMDILPDEFYKFRLEFRRAGRTNTLIKDLFRNENLVNIFVISIAVKLASK